jgi:tape measure domain-containing protein
MADKTIRIKIEGGSAQSKADRLNRSVKDVGRSADKTSSSMLNLSRVAGAVTLALSAGAVARYADSWTKVNNQIKQATKTTREALAVQEAIFTIAKESRVEIGGVAEAYQRISNSVADFGFDAKASLDVVEGLTKAFKANGASAQEVSSVLVQLGQGLGSGALQGEELRAILEASLPVSRAIAKEFGVTVGELKRLGSEGKLTTERVFTALQSALPEFQGAFDRATKTIGEGFTVLSDSGRRLVGSLSQATGAGEGLSNGLTELSAAIDELSFSIESGAAGQIAELFSSQLQLIGSDVSKTLTFIADGWNDLGIEIGSSAEAATSFVGDAFLNIIPNVRALVQIVVTEIASAFDTVKAFGVALEQAVNPFNDSTTNDAKAYLDQQLAIIKQARDSSIAAILDERAEQDKKQEQFIKQAKERQAIARQERESRQLDLSSGVLGGGTRTRGESSGGGNQGNDSVTEKLERENQMIQQSLMNRQLIYQNFFAAANDLEATEYERQTAQLAFNLASQIQQENQAFQTRLQNITDRQLSIADNKSLNEQQKQEAQRLLDEQAILARQEFENRVTEIAEEGAARRAQIEQQEAVNKINTYQGYANTALQLANAFGSKSEKENKKRRKAAVVIDTAAGISRAFAENNFYTALGISALIAANGLAQISAINSAGSSSSVSSPSGGATSIPTQATPTASTQQQSQRIIDIRGLDDNGTVTLNKSELVSLLSSDEDVILSVNNGQKQGQRVGLTNG